MDPFYYLVSCLPCYWFQGDASFVNLSFCVFVFAVCDVCFFQPCGHLLRRADLLLSCVRCFLVLLSLSHMMTWVRFGTLVYQFLIFAFSHTLSVQRVLLALLYVMFSCAFVTFPYDFLCQVWFLIVTISDLCLLSYFVSYSLVVTR